MKNVHNGIWVATQTIPIQMHRKLRVALNQGCSQSHFRRTHGCADLQRYVNFPSLPHRYSERAGLVDLAAIPAGICGPLHFM